MSTFESLFARHYDRFYAGKDYAAEARFAAAQIAARGVSPGRLLDVACGTGRHAVELAAAGWRVTGTDLSPSMLEAAARRASEAGADVSFFPHDMQRLGERADLRGAFDAAVCLFDSLGYAGDDAGVSAALRSVRALLRPGGIFVLEVWHGAAMRSGHDPARVRRWELPGGEGELIRLSETEVDGASSTAAIRFTLLRLGPDGRYERGEELHRVRFFELGAIDALLRGAGFDAVQWHAGYDPEGGKIDASCWHLVGVAKAA